MPKRLEPIVKTALLGTERRPLTASERLAIGWAPGNDDQPVRTLLEALASAQLRSKAGFVLADAPAERPLPAPFDDRPLCRPAAVALLRQILGGKYLPALPEFGALLTRTGQRLPPEVLPDLLHKALEDRSLFPEIEPLLGPTGYWLARQHLRWQALLPDPQADWFTGAFAGRQRLLLEKRRRHPLAALAWLEATWTQETSAHQARFLEILAYGLSSLDEPLLQRAAADKKDAVRLAALRLLDLLSLSPADRFQLATACTPEEMPPPVARDRWPKAVRLALLPALSVPPEVAAVRWSGLLGRLAAADRTASGFLEREEMVRILAYHGTLEVLEAGLQGCGEQIPAETRQVLGNILSFRRQMATAVAG